MSTPGSRKSPASSERTLADEDEEWVHPMQVKHGYPEENLLVRTGRKSNNLGWYPVQLGESFHNGRFVVLRKLGWGLHSNVWLARDTVDKRLVSLKILTRFRTDCQNLETLHTLEIEPPKDSSSFPAEADEIEMLVHISQADPTHPGYRHFPKLLHKFVINSAQGSHICLVTEVLCDGSEYFKALPVEIAAYDAECVGLRNYLPLRAIKELTRQLLRAVDYLHQACDIVHCDIKADHVLFRPKSVDLIASKELIDNPSAIYPSDNSSDFAKRTAPKSQPLPLLVPVGEKAEREIPHGNGPETFDWEVVLVDIGHSNWTDRKHYYEDIQPLCYRAPEVLLRYAWTSEPDIWNIGCVVVQWLTGRTLFGSNVAPLGEGWEETHLEMIQSLLGISDWPTPFLDECLEKHVDRYFTNGTDLLKDRGEGKASHRTLEQHIGRYSLKEVKSDPETLLATTEFLRRCFTVDPEERATAKELLEDDWLKVAEPGSIEGDDSESVDNLGDVDGGAAAVADE